MSAIQTALFDYGIMPVNDAINMQFLTQSIRADLGTAQNILINAGTKLIQAKETLPHGQWQNWLSVEFDMSDRTAQNMMNVAREFSDKTEIISLFKPTALYALAAPSLEPEIKQAIIAKAEAGESVDVRAEIAKLKADFNQKLEHEGKILTITQQTLNKYKSDAEKFEAQARELERTLTKKVDQVVTKKLDEKVAEKLEIEKEKLQAEVDRIAEELEQDFMERNGQLQNELSELKSQLASEQNPVLMAKLNAQLFAVEENLKAKREELEQLTVLKNQAVYEKLLIQMSTQVNETVAAYRSALLAAGNSTLPIEDKTFNLLMDASEELEKLAKLFFEIANPKNLTIEINDDEKMAA